MTNKAADILKRNKKVFWYTIIIGILTHAFRMTNTMICADTTNYFTSISPSWVTTLGRFLLPGVEKLRGNVELPWLIGLISLMMIELSAVLFTELFDIREEIFYVIIAWMFSANPVVTSIFAYMYTADGYMIALFFSVLTAYLCFRKKGIAGLLLASLSLAVSTGFYQAFLSVTILLMLFYLFRMLSVKETSMKEIGRMTGRCLATGVIGLIVYGIVLTIARKIGDYTVTNYMGMDQVGGFHVADLLQAFVDCYVDFARFYLVRFEWNCYNVMNIMMFLLTAVVWLVLVTKRKLWKTPARVVLMACLFPLLPVVCHIFEFASPDVSYTSTSMEYSLILVYLLLIIMWTDLKEMKGNILRILTVVLLLCISFHFTVIANRAYYNMENANTKVEMLLNRLEMRMEMTEGYRENMPLAIYGSCYQIPEYVPAAPMMSGVVSNIFISQDSEYVSMLNHYLSTAYGTAGMEQKKQIVATEEFAEMEPWPAENSVRVIDGVMVLYLSDTDMKKYLP